MKKEIEALGKEILKTKSLIAESSNDVFIKVYQSYINRLEEQRAELTSKIGKK